MGVRKDDNMPPFATKDGERPQHVGIHAMEVYFPINSVRQSDLETDAGVSKGKYTIGLGQQSMAYASGEEDINSIMMTAMQSLFEKYEVSPLDIGRLEGGTETLIDKSKSVKTTLCQLLNSHGNFDVEGVDNINACYGGTAALLNSVAWIESSAYDGRYALVVCGDIAVYEAGPARPTGGCAAVAMLIGPDAPIHITGARASHMEDAYDFYKPNLDSEYPVVFGHDSNICYMRALDGCYRRYAQKFERTHGEAFTLASVDNVILHSPYNRLVKKSGARMLYNDFVRYPELPIFQAEEYRQTLSNIRELPQDKSYDNKELEKTFSELARPMYASKVEVGCRLPSELGNSYTANCYTGLLSLIDAFANSLHCAQRKRVLMFSYGSGLAATMFNLDIRGDISHIARVCDLKNRLRHRDFKTPEQFTQALLEREQRYNKKGYSNPEPAPGVLWPGTFYLAENDEFGRRSYKRVEDNLVVKTHGSAARDPTFTAPALQAKSKL